MTDAILSPLSSSYFSISYGIKVSITTTTGHAIALLLPIDSLILWGLCHICCFLKLPCRVLPCSPRFHEDYLFVVVHASHTQISSSCLPYRASVFPFFVYYPHLLVMHALFGSLSSPILCTCTANLILLVTTFLFRFYSFKFLPSILPSSILVLFSSFSSDRPRCI